MSRSIRLAAVALFVVVCWAVFEFSGLRERFSLRMLHDAFAAHVVTGLLLYIALFTLGNLIQIPGWLFLAAAVLALGRFWGGIATYVAACVCCIFTFFVIRAIGGDALRGIGGRVGQRLLTRLDAHPVQSVLLLRMLMQTAPALNYVLALSGIDFGSYLLGTLLGLPAPIAVYCIFFDGIARWLHWT